MEQQSPVPAAQYVRMSTESQQYSIANQSAAIAEYAYQYGFEIVESFSDGGKSGLGIKHRSGLQRLLEEVVGGGCRYKAILVYDVSRWGRFQDTDESAHYEFLCRKAGVPVHYCAEPFPNDGTITAAMLKALKRSMAAEYSRELSAKVFAGQVRLVRLGFAMGGFSPYGLRRQLVDQHRKPKMIFRFGQQKNLKSDKVVIVPGPKREIEWVRRVFEMSLTHTIRQVETTLRRSGVKDIEGQYLTRVRLRRMLRNQMYTGVYVWGKTTSKLRTPSKRTAKESWVVRGDLFEPIIDPNLFDRVQRAIKSRRLGITVREETLLRKARKLVDKYGYLTTRLLARTPGPKTGTYVKNFGGMFELFRKVGYQPPENVRRRATAHSNRMKTEGWLIETVHELCKSRTTIVQQRRTFKPTLLVDNKIEVAVLACPRLQHKGVWGWNLCCTGKHRMGLPALVGLLDRSNQFQQFLLIPKLINSGSYFFRKVRLSGYFLHGVVLKDLSQFIDSLDSVLAEPRGAAL